MQNKAHAGGDLLALGAGIAVPLALATSRPVDRA
jgi:hypothetical protein